MQFSLVPTIIISQDCTKYFVPTTRRYLLWYIFNIIILNTVSNIIIGMLHCTHTVHIDVKRLSIINKD